MDLPNDVREILEGILRKDPETLTEYEVNFLNGRRWALNNEQRRVFASVLIKDEDTTGEGEKNTPPAQPQNPANLPPANTQYTNPDPNTANETTTTVNPTPPADQGQAQQQVPPVNPPAPEQPAATTEAPANPAGQEVQNGQSTQANPYDADPNKFDPAA